MTNLPTITRPQLLAELRRLRHRVAELEQGQTSSAPSRADLTARYALATTAGRVGIWEWDVQADRIEHDPTFWQLLGYDPADAQADPELCRRTIHPDDVEYVSRIARDHIAGKTPEYVARHRMVRADGSVMWVQARGERVETADGTQAIIGTVVDVTDQVRANEALRQSEREKSEILNLVSEMFCRYTPDRRVVWANRAAGESVGLPPEALIGRHCYEIWHGRDCPCEGCPLEEALRTGEPAEGEMPTPDGRVFFVRGYALKDSRGQITGLVEFGQDVTARKENQRRLEDYARTQEVLLREVNHRVKNSLVAIIGMLHKHIDSSCRQQPRNCADVLEDVIVRVEGLLAVHGMLSASGWGAVGLGQLCRQVMTTAVESLDASSRVQLFIPPTDLRVPSEAAHHLAMAVNELTTNSIKHAAGDGKVEIHLKFEVDPTQVRIVYSDTGPGFPPEVQAGAVAGVGLGLLEGIVRRSLRGSVELRNDFGAVTELRLPRDNFKEPQS